MAKFYSSAVPEYQADKEQFEFVQMKDDIADATFQDKPIGFFKDAMLRFCRSKVSIVAFVGIVIILFMAIFMPMMSHWHYNDQDLNRINLPPKMPVLENVGILDGTRWLTNRRVDSLEDTTRYPEGSILKVINYRKVQGVDMCDIKVDYYKYCGLEDGTYFWMGTDYLGRDLWVRMWRGARVSLVIAFISVICNVFIGIVYGSIGGILRRKDRYGYDAHYRDYRCIPGDCSGNIIYPLFRNRHAVNYSLPCRTELDWHSPNDSLPVLPL